MSPEPQPHNDQAAIPRYQRYLFWTLVGGILIALLFLLRGCKQAHDRLAAPEDETPIAAPTSAGQETFSLLLADDNAASLHLDTRRFALPAEPTTRARALLEHLIAEYALPGSPHPLGSGAAVDDVFLVTLPLAAADIAAEPYTYGATTASTYARRRAYASPATADPLLATSGQLAVINLRSAFADSHPSGIAVEQLTILSLIGTLHSNLPDVTAVRFLVDGRPRDTLAGHIDLTRTYPANAATTEMTSP